MPALCGLLAGAAGSASAQDRITDVRAQREARAQRCRATAQQLRDRPADLPALGSALAECPEDVAELLPGAWRSAAADGEHLGVLLSQSSRVRDRRLYTEARAAVLDTTRLPAVRYAALILLGSYLYPPFSGSPRRMRDGTLIFSVGTHFHPIQGDGPQPIGPTEFGEIARIISEIAAIPRTQSTGPWPVTAKFMHLTIGLVCADPARRAQVARCPD